MSEGQALTPDQLNQQGKTAYEREEFEEAARAFEAAEHPDRGDHEQFADLAGGCEDRIGDGGSKIK